MGFYDLLVLCGLWTAKADTAVTYVYPYTVTVADAATYTATLAESNAYTITVSDA